MRTTEVRFEYGPAVYEVLEVTMKKQILIMMLLIVTGVVGANAQTSQRKELRANIPFAFNVGQASLPAGEYTVVVINPSSDRKALRIRSADGHLNAIVQVMTETRKEHDQAKLIFNRYGD